MPRVFHQSVPQHTSRASQTVTPPIVPTPTLSSPESATFLLGQTLRNLLRLRFLWICFLQKTGGHLAKTSHVTNPREERSWLSSRVDKKGCTTQKHLIPRPERTP